jgi:hypothetical protein
VIAVGWNNLSRGSYIAWSLPIFVLPFIAGLGASAVEPWSDLWWNFTVDFFYVWCSWIIVSAIFGWHNNRFLRLFPSIVLVNITVLLSFVALWRTAEESKELGVLLILSLIYINIFVYRYSREIFLQEYRKRGVKIGFFILVLCPICWMIVVVSQDLFSGNIIKAYGGSICFFFLNIPFIASSIRFREPELENKKENLKN